MKRRAPDGNLENLTFHPVEYNKLGEGKQASALLMPGGTGHSGYDAGEEYDARESNGPDFSRAHHDADHIYHLIKLGPGRYWSRAETAEVELDDDLLKPLVSGEDALPFATPPTDKHLLFPYHVAPDDCRLLTEQELKRYKRRWKYLSNHEQELRAREGGKFDDDQWCALAETRALINKICRKLGFPRPLITSRHLLTPKASCTSTMCE